MKKTLIAGLAFGLLASTAYAETFTVTVTNNLTEELLAPIVVTDAGNDSFLFTDGYVTAAAESQILTGDPMMVVEAIGADQVTVAHGTDGPPGVLLAAGSSVTFTVETEATAWRILAMVAPTMVPDTYVTALADVSAGHEVTIELGRYDIGNDEGTKMIVPVGDMMHSAATVKITHGM
ncbi:MAG: hypothetical protein GQ535_03665 [Rhodobacteraceae bacterium]|nr:hypothetical protein [Paracoccaceae bacterium]